RFQIEATVHRWRLAEADSDLCARHRQVLAGADVKRYAAPAPRVNLQLQGGEGLNLRAGRHTRLLQVPPKMAAHQVLCLERRHRLEHSNLLITNGFGVSTSRRFHR